MNDVEENEANKKLSADKRTSDIKMKHMLNNTKDQEKRGKYSAKPAFSMNKEATAKILIKAVVVNRISTMPKNFPTIYSERDMGFERTI